MKYTNRYTKSNIHKIKLIDSYENIFLIKRSRGRASSEESGFTQTNEFNTVRKITNEQLGELLTNLNSGKWKVLNEEIFYEIY